MVIKVINPEPDPSVKKQLICHNCGVTLEYTPFDVRKEVVKDYTGSADTYSRIDCPNCQQVINVR